MKIYQKKFGSIMKRFTSQRIVNFKFGSIIQRTQLSSGSIIQLRLQLQTSCNQQSQLGGTALQWFYQYKMLGGIHRVSLQGFRPVQVADRKMSLCTLPIMLHRVGRYPSATCWSAQKTFHSGPNSFVNDPSPSQKAHLQRSERKSCK